MTGYKGLYLYDNYFVSAVGYTMLSSSNSSINMLWECSSSWTNTEPLAICWLYVSFVDFLEGLDVPVTIKSICYCEHKIMIDCDFSQK